MSAFYSFSGKLTDCELRSYIKAEQPKSDWDRFFKDKFKNIDIEKAIEKVHNYRNDIAHFKFFYKDSYEDLKKELNSLIKYIDKANRIVLDIDFKNKCDEEEIIRLAKQQETLLKIGELLAEKFRAFEENLKKYF